MPWRAHPAREVEGEGHHVVEDPRERYERRRADTGVRDVHLRSTLSLHLAFPLPLGFWNYLAKEIGNVVLGGG